MQYPLLTIGSKNVRLVLLLLLATIYFPTHASAGFYPVDGSEWLKMCQAKFGFRGPFTDPAAWNKMIIPLREEENECTKNCASPTTGCTQTEIPEGTRVEGCKRNEPGEVCFSACSQQFELQLKEECNKNRQSRNSPNS